MKTFTTSWWFVLAGLLLAPFAVAGAQSPQAKPQAVGIGVFSFMSGPAASYGMPGYNAAHVVIDQINKNGGIDGVPIKATYVDEAQGTKGVIAQFRRLSSDKTNQAMIAALSSSNCLALAPVADELHMPMVTWNCDTYQLFAKHVWKYVHRANSNVIPEFLAYVLYALQNHPDMKRVAIIGPDYALGHDADKITKAALKRFRPDAKVVAELYPKLGTATYLTDISRLLAARPDVIFVNLWGGDLTTFVRQAEPRGLFKTSDVILTVGETILQNPKLGLPQGVVVGCFGAGYWLSPAVQANPAAQAFVAEYHKRYGKYPPFPAFKMANAILALKAGYHRAIAANGGAWPSAEQLTNAFSGLKVKTFSGTLGIRKADHDGLRDQIVGVTAKSKGHPYMVMTEMVRYPAAKVTPPAGVDPFKWIGNLPANYIDGLPKPGSYK